MPALPALEVPAKPGIRYETLMLMQVVARLVIALVPALILSFPVLAQTPEWIWHPATNDATSVYFRKTFRTPPLLWNARLTVAADDEAEVFLNGISIATCDRWDRPVRSEVSVRLNQGGNALCVRAKNRAGNAGLLVHFSLNGETNLISDASWLVANREESGWSSLSFNAAHWLPAHSFGRHGIAPWGEILGRAGATRAEALNVPPGFHVELLRSAEPGEGSWIRLRFDPSGRLFISPQGDELSLLRLAFERGQVAKVEPVPSPIRYAMGLLFAFDSLYANARGPGGAGLYRLTDVNGNDRFDSDEVRLLKRFEGGSEHGYHDLALGPDGKIYVLNGNGTKLPTGLSPHSAHQRYAEDVLSLNPDETTEARDTFAPNCHVLRTDADGKEWELWMGGLRNAYGFDFNADGQLFAFDSDMEWDWGTPWYRPTRIVHCVSGGEYGWRDGTRTWPDYYEDALPGVASVGIGSPTGLRFGTASRFPEQYRRALFGLDWSYGRIFAVHLEPRGASYGGTVETFLRGTPLNLTDLTFGPDGAMYFITGGRGTQSGLYRVSYTNRVEAAGTAPSVVVGPTLGNTADARSLRQALERFHGRSDHAATDFLWPHLASDDRFLRHAARVALESQDLPHWKARALAETNSTAGLTALLALARAGGVETQGDLFKALAQFPLDSLSEQQKLLQLRVVQISFLRQGRPTAELAPFAIAKLGPAYPGSSWPLNRELSRLLLYLDAPGVISKTLDLLGVAPTQEEQFHYVAQLRNARRGWSIGNRRRYLEWWLKPRDAIAHRPELTQWFADVGRSYVDGAWVDKYLGEFRRDALAALAPEERAALGSLVEAPIRKARLEPASHREFVRAWTLAAVLPELDRVKTGRNAARGRQVFVEAQCLACHRFGNDGGWTGPELTAAGSKYDARSLLESLLEPSRVINEQYQNSLILLKGGGTLTGRVVGQTVDELLVETDPISGTRQKIPRKEIQELNLSPVSAMPDGLLNNFTRDEILDLLAWLTASTPAP